MINFNEKYYKDPHKFNPSRWLENSENSAEKNDPFVFTPFSAGPRNCIGQHLAMNEIKIILGLFITRFDFSINKDYRLRMTMKLLHGPIDPLMFKLNVRK